MLAIKLNKNWWVAGAFCALAMNINTVLGITEEEFNKKHDRLVNELIPIKGEHGRSGSSAKFIVQRAGFLTAEVDDVYSICYLLCLDYSPNVILWLINEKNISPTAVIGALMGKYEDLEPCMREILDTFAACSEEWELNLSLFEELEAQINEWSIRKSFGIDRNLGRNTLTVPTKKWREELEQQIDIWIRKHEKFRTDMHTNLNILAIPTKKWIEEFGVQIKIWEQKFEILKNLGNYKMCGCFVSAFISELVRGNNSLTVLLLNNLGMGDHAVASVFEALRDNPNSSLKKIDLSRIFVRDYGMEAIAETLKTNTSLNTLIVFGCEIGDEGIMALSEALKINTSLNFLDMRKNQISDTGKGKLADAMEKNTTIIDMKY